MGTLNRTELDRLERRELQLTILAAAFVLIQAAGLAMFMYPLVFLHPIGNKWTLRASFFGFCALTLLFVVLQAPDVALSMLVVGAVAYPLVLLVAIAVIRKEGDR